MARRTLRQLLGIDACPLPEPPWQVLTEAANEPEAELVAQLLGQEGIPASYRRPPGHDDTQIAGVCQVLVAPARLEEARELLASLQAAGEEAPAA